MIIEYPKWIKFEDRKFIVYSKEEEDKYLSKEVKNDNTSDNREDNSKGVDKISNDNRTNTRTGRKSK